MHFFPRVRLTGLLALSVVACAWGQSITVVTEEYPPYNFQDAATHKISGRATEVVARLRRPRATHHEARHSVPVPVPVPVPVSRRRTCCDQSLLLGNSKSAAF